MRDPVGRLGYNGKIKLHILTADEMTALISKFEAAEKLGDMTKKAEGR